MRRMLQAVGAFLALLLLASSAEANLFIREKGMRSATEKSFDILVQAPSGSRPWFVLAGEAEGSHFYAGDIPCDGSVTPTLLSGKSPEVRGERKMEKKPLVIRWRWMPGGDGDDGEDQEFHILGEQNKQTERDRLQALQNRGYTKDFIKKHFLYQGLVEGTIPAREIRGHVGQVLQIVADFDQHDDRFEAKLVVLPYTLHQFELFETVRRGGDPAAMEALQRSFERPGVPLASPRGGEEVPRRSGGELKRHHRRPAPDTEDDQDDVPPTERRGGDDFEDRLFGGDKGVTERPPDAPAPRSEPSYDRHDPVLRVRTEGSTPYVHLVISGYDARHNPLGPPVHRWVRVRDSAWFEEIGANKLRACEAPTVVSGQWYTIFVAPRPEASKWEVLTPATATWQFDDNRSATGKTPVKMWRAGSDGLTLSLRRNEQ